MRKTAIPLWIVVFLKTSKKENTMNTPQQNNGATAPGSVYSPDSSGNPPLPPQEPPFIPYQKPAPPPPPPYFGQLGGYPPYPGK